MAVTPPIDLHLRCRGCGTRFLFSAYEVGRFGRPREPRCQACRAANLAKMQTAARDGGYVDVERVCVDCGEAFVWTGLDQALYRARAFAPPRRCRPCRELRRQAPTPGAA